MHWVKIQAEDVGVYFIVMSWEKTWNHLVIGKIVGPCGEAI